MVPPGSSEEVVQAIRVELGTDRPILEQFWIYLRGLARGDLGESFRYERPVLDLVLDALPATLALGSLSILLALVISIPFGTLAAARPGSWLDKGILVVAMIGQSLPNFWIGVMLVLLFSIRLQWLPAIGNQTASAYILPVITLSAVLIAALLRIVRQSVLEALSEDYIRAARAKGCPPASNPVGPCTKERLNSPRNNSWSAGGIRARRSLRRRTYLQLAGRRTSLRCKRPRPATSRSCRASLRRWRQCLSSPTSWSILHTPT